MSKRTTSNRRVAATGMVFTSITALAGCASPNYEGTGNDYRVAGVIESVEADGTINIHNDKLRVIEAAGKAATWFVEGKGQHTFTDIFYFEPSHNKEQTDFFGSCEHDVPVGRIFNVEGTEITLAQLEAAQEKTPQTIILSGDIRDSSYKTDDGCKTEDRPVYEAAHLTYKPMDQIK